MSDEALTLTVNQRLDQEKEFEQIVMKTLRQYRPTLDAIADVLSAAGVNETEAETLLLWMAGTSHALRGEPVTSDLTLYTLARSWQFAASKLAN